LQTEHVGCYEHFQIGRFFWGLFSALRIKSEEVSLELLSRHEAEEKLQSKLKKGR
jgi:hypothetical protein